MEEYTRKVFMGHSPEVAHIMCVHILLGEIQTKGSSCRGGWGM